MWNKDYLDKIIERTNKRISSLSEKLLEVKPARQMPEEDQVTIGSGRQMEVAVLFLDICNYSTWFNDSYDSQKIVLSIMNIFMAEMINIVRDYKGEFEKNTGDGLMAYFGTETNNSSECVKLAIDAALTMHYFNDSLFAPYMYQQGAQAKVEFRVGIDYGKITIGRVGAPGGFNSFVAIGTTANIANKLLKVAGSGEIVIGQHVKDLLPSYRQKYCKLILMGSGFEYIRSQTPYWAYRYTSRWKHPQLT
ncbi:MAG: adenylate/guanylate cyclase domain-containing protein [Elusimicrobia bacterium]|nr:adenylate/guanylate cyclase domain-containing protein [Elusimicrobiota bacterium]